MIRRLIFKIAIISFTISSIRAMASKHIVNMDLTNKVIGVVKESIVENKEFFTDLGNAVWEEFKESLAEVIITESMIDEEAQKE